MSLNFQRQYWHFFLNQSMVILFFDSLNDPKNRGWMRYSVDIPVAIEF